MKKILVVLNERHVSEKVVNKAIDIAKETGSFIEVVFLNDLSAFVFGYPFPNDLSFATSSTSIESETTEAITTIKSEAQLFEEKCKEQNVRYSIDVYQFISVDELIDLSSFSDLIIAAARFESGDYDFKEVLADAHCPVLLVPWNGENSEKIIFAYDGSILGMYALKMFSYLFPEYKSFPVKLVHVAPAAVQEIPNIDAIQDWASNHFTNMQYDLVDGKPGIQLIEYIKKDSENSIVVMAAYNRSSISRLLFKSLSEAIINETKATIFIAHQ